MKIKFKIFFISFFLFWLFLLLGFYIYNFYEFPKPPERDWLFNYYSKDLILKTGSRLGVPEERLQHFLNFPPVKEEGAIRVGVFGCSYTYSKRVNKEASYPHQLQVMINKRFPDRKVEVLNFGVKGAGFHEQFFLWEEYAEKYNLDYVLMGPRTFYKERESTFREEDSGYFEYPKERFILLADDRLKRVYIRGQTLKKRYKNYYTLFPSYTALRYDIRPFKVLEKFLRREIKNPFYYKKLITEELTKINILLLDKIKKVHPKRVLIIRDKFGKFERFDTEDYYSVNDRYNINYINYPYEEEVLYRNSTHYSSLGYEIPAKFFFHALIGEKKFSLNSLKCHYNSYAGKKESGNSKNVVDLNLSNIKSIEVKTKKIPLIKVKLVNNYKPKKINYEINQDIKSFIGFSSIKPSGFGNAVYIPLSHSLKGEMRVYVQLPNEERIALGTIKPLDVYGKLFNFYEGYVINNSVYYNLYYGTYFILKKMPLSIKKKIEGAFTSQNSLELFIEKRSIGWLKPITLKVSDDNYLINRLGEKILRFLPHKGYNDSLLMMGPSHYVSEKDLPVEFPLHIHYNMNEGRKLVSPVFNWNCKKQKQQIHLNLPNFTPL